MAVAAIGEILVPGRMLPDHRPLAAVGLITPHPGLLPIQQLGQHHAVDDIRAVATTAWISLVRMSTSKCSFIPKHHWLPFLVWCISGSRALSAFLIE